ncbi:MAG: 5-formyltetrahydrofolate cyclo-ligase [Geminicoccaceae bacterium]|nr:5-formyltetrahydrofolate cyclo-ligase [Geminicoccaceae bacterium]
MSDPNDDAPSGFASPPCFMHEVDPLYAGLARDADPRQRADVMRWRKAERERLIAARLAIRGTEREARAGRIDAGLEEAVGDARGLTVSACWPFKGEPDLRPFLKGVIARGGRAALPVVVARGQPLVFRLWTPGARLERGVWNIPIPADGAEVVPDVVLAPVVGFDPLCYRLGYGGGFFDRTLAAMPSRRRVVGVGYAEEAAIPTIYPQWHDVPMDAIVTEAGIVRPRADEGA